jgi:hypothetical protein
MSLQMKLAFVVLATLITNFSSLVGNSKFKFIQPFTQLLSTGCLILHTSSFSLSFIVTTLILSYISSCTKTRNELVGTKTIFHRTLKMERNYLSVKFHRTYQAVKYFTTSKRYFPHNFKNGMKFV